VDRLERAEIDRLTRELTDRGKLIEAGWLGLRLAVISPTAPPVQLDEMRMAFFAGAQHLFSSILGILDPGSEATDGDMARMDQIHTELREFEKYFRLKATAPRGRG
jgi:hypothetical protein